MRILTIQQENLLKQERQTLDNLRQALTKMGASSEVSQVLAESIAQLDELFLLVVVGEFNAGKSAFINALLGQKLLKEGVTPTTTQINLLRYGPIEERLVLSEHQHMLRLPVDWLAEISVVDTPGTNAILREHEALTEQFVPRSDLVLFITSADRPFTESERKFLEQIRAWGKKIIFVINKIDILETEDDINQVQTFVYENARALLGLHPEIFPVSARLALQSKLGQPSVWAESRFEALENYIRSTLDEKNRLQLKLRNPLGVAIRLTENYQEITQERLDLLRVDMDMLENVENQLSVYGDDMRRDFDYRMSDLEKPLFEMEQRGMKFFEETFRLVRVFDLMQKDRIRAEFEQRVVADAPLVIEKKVNEMIDWLVDSDLSQWQAVNDHLAERRKLHQQQLIGDSGKTAFHYDRERLIDGIGRQAQEVVGSYDRNHEAQSIARGAQEAVAASAVLEVGALGLGALVAAIATTAAADITGILFASLVAALGLIIIPARRRQAEAEMRKKIAELRLQLISALRTQFEDEMQGSIKKITDVMTPYTRFVRSERTRLEENQAFLKQIRQEIAQYLAALEEF
jgi:small GTP-binding protein